MAPRPLGLGFTRFGGTLVGALGDGWGSADGVGSDVSHGAGTLGLGTAGFGVGAGVGLDGAGGVGSGVGGSITGIPPRPFQNSANASSKILVLMPDLISSRTKCHFPARMYSRIRALSVAGWDTDVFRPVGSVACCGFPSA